MRGHAIRQKVSTPFGSLYAEIAYSPDGDVVGIGIAHPQKHADTAVGDALDALADAFNRILEDNDAR